MSSVTPFYTTKFSLNFKVHSHRSVAVFRYLATGHHQTWPVSKIGPALRFSYTFDLILLVKFYINYRLGLIYSFLDKNNN